jgi:molybdopterin molybdotransferase
MISYAEALALLVAEARRLPLETLPLKALSGRFLAEVANAQIDVPSFNNSAMDGFALVAAQTEAASIDTPVTLAVSHCLAAGDGLPVISPETTAIEIMTGAVVPSGFDAVVPIENVQCRRNETGQVVEITLNAPLVAGENMRYRGEDFVAGSLVRPRGARVDAAALAALAATGTAQLQVYRQPRIGLMATGKEINDVYGEPLAPSAIYNSNIPYLETLFAEAGYASHYLGNIGDDPELFACWLNEYQDCDVLISSGAVSKGKWDFIPAVLQEQGARIIFHGVAIKPGKPVLFAVLPDGRYFFGLPGNPVAAAVGARFFVQPLFRAMLGLALETPLYLPLRSPYTKKGPLRHFLKSRMQVESSQLGRLGLELLPGQESFKISPLLAMNGWAVVEESQQKLSTDTALAWWSTSLFPHW